MSYLPGHYSHWSSVGFLQLSTTFLKHSDYNWTKYSVFGFISFKYILLRKLWLQHLNIVFDYWTWQCWHMLATSNPWFFFTELTFSTLHFEFCYSNLLHTEIFLISDFIFFFFLSIWHSWAPFSIRIFLYVILFTSALFNLFLGIMNSITSWLHSPLLFFTFKFSDNSVHNFSIRCTLPCFSS